MFFYGRTTAAPPLPIQATKKEGRKIIIHTGTQVAHLLYFDCKIGDFKIAGCVCLQKKVYLPSLLQGIFW